MTHVERAHAHLYNQGKWSLTLGDVQLALDLLDAIKQTREQPDAVRPERKEAGYCPNHKMPGGCQLPNVQCGYPDCDRFPPTPERKVLQPLTNDQLRLYPGDNVRSRLCFSRPRHISHSRRGGGVQMTIEATRLRNLLNGLEEYGHNHECTCGTATTTPHQIGEDGCARYMVNAPTEVSPERWVVDGDEITDYTLRHQRGYHQHECGCWSKWPGSTNSL